MNQILGKMFIHPEKTFESFVVGHSNQRAYEASHTVARNPGMGLNPLFIYSSQGCGGTHLSQAILNHVLKESTLNKDRVCWITTEQFVYGLRLSIQHETLPSFRTYFGSLDMLLIDDVQFMELNGQAQEEFRQTFNTLYDNMKQIVITCDRHPTELNDTEELLQSRFQRGSIVEIRVPELQTKLTILEQLAHKEGIELPRDVAMYLAGDSATSIRVLEARLIRLLAKSRFDNLPISLDLAKGVLQDYG